MSAKQGEVIELRGVQQNNLQDIDVDIPVGQLVVVTGLSGAGKSSLVFETLHAEGHRRYAETFSAYARQFLDLLDRPKVREIRNIRPSIAIEQGNSVKTSRSTVGTMTELTDYCKVWFSHVARLYDPDSGEEITVDNPESIWRKASVAFAGETLCVSFAVSRPGKLRWADILQPLMGQGFTRAILGGEWVRIDELDGAAMAADAVLYVVQDRLRMEAAQRGRFVEAVASALSFGQEHVHLFSADGKLRKAYCAGLHLPGSERRFRAASPNLFSFNSPLGACQRCRGFGRIIEIDDRLVIPDERLSLADGAIRAFSGAVYSESQRDLLRGCQQRGVRTHVAWQDLRDEERDFVLNGDPEYAENGPGQKRWYGVRRFFKWLEDNTYKMHVRVFLSRYRAYVECPDCGGARLQPESLCWKWRGYSLPDLYRLPICQLLPLFDGQPAGADVPQELAQAITAIRTRLRYLQQVGLDYLSLDRASRTLSGGETQRVNLTACLGTALVDTLFILDEPSVGLHQRDIHRLIAILRELTAMGNTVVVVEHDEAIMRAADWLIEVGPGPGSGGGRIVYSGPAAGITEAAASVTGAFLSGRRSIQRPAPPRLPDAHTPWLRLTGIHQHNLRGLAVEIPLERLVVLTGVSGSGKSTLLHDAIHAGLLARAGKAVEQAARIEDIQCDRGFSEILLVDQSPVSRTPRSNPVLFVGAWDAIRQLFAQTPAARQAALTPAHFSFNSGDGRCPHCSGLGHERVEMQFMADVYVPCPICDGRQFREDILAVRWQELSVAEVLQLTVADALQVFAAQSAIVRKLRALEAVGLDYLRLGQPLNTLSGGESQRIKLIRYLGGLDGRDDPALLLLDEPTTGLHRADIERLLGVLHKMVARGHSLVVIEHQPDVIAAADWVLELGPEAGDRGGKLMYAGPVDGAALATAAARGAAFCERVVPRPAPSAVACPGDARAAVRPEPAAPASISLRGAREHNLKNISVDIPRRAMTVVTGLSGSGKSTLAFDIIFAEGQRRFMESMSSWARQYVEQLPKPDIDALSGIPPTIAIEQRVTHGSAKSTVATITEVAQYLRLLYARIGTQYSPVTGEPLLAMPADALAAHLHKRLLARALPNPNHWHLLAPLVRNRKGHHEPLANWAREHGFSLLRIDGRWVDLDRFERLDRYREHTIEVSVANVLPRPRKPIVQLAGGDTASIEVAVHAALQIGKGTFLLANRIDNSASWFSTRRSDPVTGEAFPELDPKDFSWNAARGWCPVCRGYGQLEPWMRSDDSFDLLPRTFSDGDTCPACQGERLNPVSRHVFLETRTGERFNLPRLLALTPPQLLATLHQLELDSRADRIFREVLPEILERLTFMASVGLDYLSLDRSTRTLSGGEAQRIRLAAQLGSNLTGALYVLDEPSIGLHERDNERLLQSLAQLRAKGNTLLVVEHDLKTLEAADHIIDLGPRAGIHGGEVVAVGSLQQIRQAPASLTAHALRHGIAHPLRGQRRPLPPPFHPRRKGAADDWLVLTKPTLRNLKGDSVHIPKGRLVGVCGISGAGKSTLVRDLLLPAVQRAIEANANRLKGRPTQDSFDALIGAAGFRKVIEVDQSPIGKTPRSTPATYLGIFDRIRERFATLPEARLHGFTKSTFSFNTKGGRCDACEGAGRIRLEMSFMPDSYLPCDSCNGSRFRQELHAVRWNGHSIADVLALSFDAATSFFATDAFLRDTCQLMVDTGLGYLTLGQPSPSLSGGEAQRLKLVAELARGLPTFAERRNATILPNLYLLEEPTIGLHLHDCERLVHLLHQLTDQGHSVLLIEHHLDLLAEADYLIEIGPAGGVHGGYVLFQGPTEAIIDCAHSPTAPFLSKILRN